MNKKLSDSFFRDIKKRKLKANHGHLLVVYYISAGYMPEFVVQRYKLRPNKPNNLRTFLLKQHLHSKSHQILCKWKHVKINKIAISHIDQYISKKLDLTKACKYYKLVG